MDIPRITYLLGAGASARCVPIVASLMNELIGLEVKILELIRNKYDIGPQSEDFWSKNIGNLTYYRNFFEHLKWLRESSAEHETVDTLARKFYQISGEDSNDLNKLKLTLSVAFTILQCCNPLNFENKQYPDRRYDKFLAAILKREKGGLTIPENVKILSWNYDMQFEMAAIKYFQTESVDELQYQLKAMPSHYFRFKNQIPTIVRLNGVAGMYSGRETEIQNLHLSRGLRNWTDVFDELSFVFEPTKPYSKSFKSQFTFAWEKDAMSGYALETAKKIVSQTDILVIIGYSFPTFNRTIDSQILSAFINAGGKTPKKVYVQNKIDNSRELSEHYQIHERFITYRENCDEFFIPSGIEI